MTTTELVERVRAPSSNECADMHKLLVVFVVLGGHVELAELKYQHNKVRERERERGKNSLINTLAPLM